MSSVNKGYPVKPDYNRFAFEHVWHMNQHQELANRSSPFRDTKLHQDAADGHAEAARMNNKAAKDSSYASAARAATERAFSLSQKTYLGKGRPDKSPWTIYSHAFDVKKKDMGKSSNPIEYHMKKMEEHKAQMVAHPDYEKRNLHGEAMGLHLQARGRHIRGDSRAAETSKKADAASEAALGKSESSLTKKGKLKSSALHELHHPRTATQTREAIAHLKEHSDAHTPGEQQALAERVRRAAKKHGIPMSEAKSPEAAKRNLERKARMAKKALDSITSLQKAVSHAMIGGGQPPSTNPTGGIRRALPELMEKEGTLQSGAHRTFPKEYRETGATEEKHYGDPKNKKYPIHTENNVRAAISNFSKPKNASVYSPEEQKAIWGRIRRAAKKFKIEIGEESGPPSVSKSVKAADVEAERERVMGPAGRYPGFKFSDSNQQLMDRFDDLMRVSKAAKEGPAMGKPTFLGVHTIYAKPGESFSGGPKEPTEKIKEKLGKYSPTREKLDEASKAAVEGQDTDKGYPLGMGPKMTTGGGQLWLDRPTDKKKKEKKIDLSKIGRASCRERV
jgi:2-hydroxychromene-2-carboxylate isomerase